MAGAVVMVVVLVLVLPAAFLAAGAAVAALAGRSLNAIGGGPSVAPADGVEGR